MIKEYERELNELQESKLISKEDLHEGDEIIYNGEHYFVTRTDTGTDFVWITDDESERYNRNAQGWTLKAGWIDEVIGQPEEDELEEAVKTSDRYEVARYSRFWYGIMDNHTNLLLRVGPNADYSKPLDKENNKLLLFHNREEAQSYIDSKLSSRQDLKESTVNESLDFTNFAFIVKCNDGPKELVRVIAEDRFKAEEYAKKMYAQNHTTYADDRYNVWSIEAKNESLNGNNAKKIPEFETYNLTESKEGTQYGVHSFSQSSIIFRGTEEECAEFIADHNLWDDAEIYAMTPDDPHYLKEAEEKLTTYYQIWAKGPSDSKFHFQDEYAYLSDLVEEAKGFMHGDAQVRVLEVEEDKSGNIVKRNGEVLFYSDGAVQTVDKELFDVATPQETADMFGKKVYSKKENKLYTPTGPVFEAAKLSPEEKLEREFKKLDDTKNDSLKEFYNEDGLENATQEYTSANTSINSAKLPAIFSMVNFKPETINLDYGGGKFDNATTALEGKGVTNLIYDPYNRSSGHNKDVIDTVRKNGGADTVTCSNVLNVIKEPEARKAVIKNIYSLLKNGGTAYFTVYEGTGKGNEGPTKSGYQLNKKTGDYVEEISSVFPSVSRRGKLIIASKETSLTEEFDDDWSDTLETGGEPTYCPDCGVKFVRDEEGDAICPKCNKTPYQLANERRKNESLNEDDRYTVAGREKMVSDETMYRAVEAAKTVDPNAKSDYDDDFIYGDDGHGGSTWVILLNGDGKAYSTWGRNAVLTSKVEKAVNDAADAYWADFDKRWEENNKHLAGKKMKESALNETYYAVIEVDGKERRFPFNNRDTARDYIAKAQRGELPEFKGKKIGSTYTEALNVVREEVKPNIESKDGSVNESLASRQADTDAQEKSIKAIENTLDSLGIKVHYGTKIGKYPQTVILDIKYQDNAIYIISNGKVLINGDYEGEVNPKDKEAVKQMLIEYEFIDDDSVTESLDFTNTADVRHRLDSYSGQYLTVTFRGSYDWKYISDLLEEYNDGDEEEADLALDKLEAVYRSEYKLLKALEVDEISEITAMDRGVLVTIKVDKDDLYHNYADLINNPSIKKDTVKILELELNESLKKRYKKFSLKESTSKEKAIKEDLAVNGEETLVDTANKPAVKPAVIIIKVESSISADGFEVTVKGTDGSIIDQHSFRYGYNAAYSRLGVDKYRPFVTDIINRYLSKYNLNKDNIIVTKGRNAFKGTDVSDEAVADFKTKYLGSHLDESKNGSLKENYGKRYKKSPVMEGLDFTDEAEIRKQLAKYSGQYLTITFKGSEDWKHISDLLDESINSDEEEEEELALDKLEASYGREYDLLKSLEVEEISEIVAYTSYVIVTIKVEKDNLLHNFSDKYLDFIHMPSIDTDTIKILELDKSTI